jgi:dolichol-phosphate mannosyltransferase
MELSIVLPAWNEAENLNALVPALRGALEGVVDAGAYEIVVVDGGSKDGTPEVARALGCVCFRQETPGYGGALREGFKVARGAFLCTLDADLSHPPTFIAEMWRRREEADLVVASRYVPGGKADMPRLREVLSRVLNRTFGELLAIPVKDLSSGFRLYRREALERFETRGRNFNVLQELLTGILARGGRVVEVPFHYMPRIHGVSHARIIRFGLSYLGSLWHLFFVRTALFRAEPAVRLSPYLLVVVAAVFAAYAGSLGNGWVRWDDDYLVFENPALRTIDGPALAAMFDPRGPEARGEPAGAPCPHDCVDQPHAPRHHYGSQYAPLGDLSYALDGAVFGWRDARPFHVQGVLWHALAAALLFLVANRHLRAAGVALTAALVFALHPVATESVAWISGRRTAMSLAILLAAALAWARARARLCPASYLASVLATAAACLSKQNGVSVPLVLLAMEWTRAPEEAPVPAGTPAAAPAAIDPCAGRPGAGCAPFSPLAHLALLPHAAIAAVYAKIALDVGVREGIIGPFPLGPLGQAQAALLALAHYASMLVWPAYLRPSYALVFTPTEFGALLAAGGALLLLAAAGTLAALRRGARAGAFAGLGTAATLAPALGAVGTQIVGERYLYAPLAFVAIAAGALFARLSLAGPPPRERAEEESLVRRRRVLTFTLVALLVVAGAVTHGRNRAWRDDIALWEDAALKEPGNRVARRLLGEALLRRGGPGDLARAEGELLAAFSLEQAQPPVRGASPLPSIADRLARLMEMRGDVAGAESLLAAVAGRMPDSERAALHLAEHWTRRGERGRARGALAAFVDRRPDALAARARLAALGEEGKRPEAPTGTASPEQLPR